MCSLNFKGIWFIRETFSAVEQSLNILNSTVYGIKVKILQLSEKKCLTMSIKTSQYGNRKTSKNTKWTIVRGFKSKTKQFYLFIKEYYLYFITEMTLNKCYMQFFVVTCRCLSSLSHSNYVLQEGLTFIVEIR